MPFILYSLRTKIIAYTDDKINAVQMIIFVFDILEKEKMMITGIFSFFSQCFQKPFFFGLLKSQDQVAEVNGLIFLFKYSSYYLITLS